MTDQFDPNTLHGISFVSNYQEMRYIYPDAGHWTAGWILRKTRGGMWVTMRQATDDDIAAINRAVVKSHHADGKF